MIRVINMLHHNDFRDENILKSITGEYKDNKVVRIIDRYIVWKYLSNGYFISPCCSSN